jgi:hypothetical protein
VKYKHDNNRYIISYRLLSTTHCILHVARHTDLTIRCKTIPVILKFCVGWIKWTYNLKALCVRMCTKEKKVTVKGCETSRLPHFLDNRLTDGADVVSLTRRPPFIPREDSWYTFLLEAPMVIVRLEGLGQLKNPMTSAGIEPATFRLVA